MLFWLIFVVMTIGLIGFSKPLMKLGPVVFVFFALIVITSLVAMMPRDPAPKHLPAKTSEQKAKDAERQRHIRTMVIMAAIL